MDAIRAFAGDDVEIARYYPRDKQFLVEMPLRVEHHEVVAGESEPFSIVVHADSNPS